MPQTPDSNNRPSPWYTSALSALPSYTAAILIERHPIRDIAQLMTSIQGPVLIRGHDRSQRRQQQKVSRSKSSSHRGPVIVKDIRPQNGRRRRNLIDIIGRKYVIAARCCRWGALQRRSEGFQFLCISQFSADVNSGYSILRIVGLWDKEKKNTVIIDDVTAVFVIKNIHWSTSKLTLFGRGFMTVHISYKWGNPACTYT